MGKGREGKWKGKGGRVGVLAGVGEERIMTKLDWIHGEVELVLWVVVSSV